MSQDRTTYNKLLLSTFKDSLLTDCETVEVLLPQPIILSEAEFFNLVKSGDIQRIRTIPKLNNYVIYKDNEGYTSLHWAVSQQHKEVVELLLANGADVNSQNNIGYTPLHLAAIHGSDSLVKLLLVKSAAIDAQDHEQNTPLHRACRYGHQSTVALLLKNRANYQLLNKDNETPLKVASNYGYRAIVKIISEMNYLTKDVSKGHTI